MAKSPDIGLLEETLFAYLKRQTVIAAIAAISAQHPASKTELGGKGRVVFGFLNDLAEGTMVSRAIAMPSFQFACYDTTYANARRLQQLVRDRLEDYSPTDLNMTGQRVTDSYRENSVGSIFDNQTGLFVAVVEFRFNLSNYEV